MKLQEFQKVQKTQMESDIQIRGFGGTETEEQREQYSIQLLSPGAYYTFSLSLSYPESPERLPFSKIYADPRALARGSRPDQP